MNRFAVLSAVLTLSATVAVPALAQMSVQQAAAPQRPQRVVMLCDSDAATRAAYRRDFGSDPVFVTADQTLRARSTREAWTTPRCMTAREHSRLTQTLGAYASVR